MYQEWPFFQSTIDLVEMVRPPCAGCNTLKTHYHASPAVCDWTLCSNPCEGESSVVANHECGVRAERIAEALEAALSVAGRAAPAHDQKSYDAGLSDGADPGQG